MEEEFVRGELVFFFFKGNKRNGFYLMFRLYLFCALFIFYNVEMKLDYEIWSFPRLRCQLCSFRKQK